MEKPVVLFSPAFLSGGIEIKMLGPFARREAEAGRAAFLVAMERLSLDFNRRPPVADLRRGRIEDALHIRRGYKPPSIAALLAAGDPARVVLPPPGSLGARSPEAYLAGLHYDEMGIGALAAYSEEPDPRFVLVWWGLVELLAPILDACRTGAEAFDRQWRQSLPPGADLDKIRRRA